MEYPELNKEERRRILGTLSNWNVGITPKGELATKSCFVHNTVPDIYFMRDTEAAIQSIYTSTKSEWTSNLIQSNTSNPVDTETLKSLSVCKSISQKTEPTLFQSNTETIHLTTQSVKAYILVDNIARLTKEFEDELSKAEKHWPHSPQESWDKLCLIWSKYGFLWPQRVQIGFKIHEKHEIKNGDATHIENIKNQLQKKSQGILHSPKHYSVIWRTKLKPVHEYFPIEFNRKKEFINNIIHKFSILAFSDSLFKLRNVRSGDYLGRQSLDSSSDPGVIVIPSNNKPMNTSNIFWKFNDSISTMEQSTPYLFAGNNKFLYSGQPPIDKEVTILSKLQQQHNSPNNVFQSRANIKLIQYRQTNKQLSSSTDDMDENWKWSIGITNTTTNNDFEGIFYLDKAINNYKCLVHGDEITLNQHSFYLRTASNNPNFTSFRPDSTNNNSPFAMERHSTITKSPLSLMSYGDQQYSFSPAGVMSESNSTQPTSGYNSSFSSLSLASKVRNHTPQSNSFVLLEKLSKRSNVLCPPAEYRWKIEMISRSLKDEQEEEMVNVVKSLSIKSSRLGDDNNSNAKTMIKPYSPKLNLDITRFSSPTDTMKSNNLDNKNQILSLNNYNTLVSSLVVPEIGSQVLQNRQNKSMFTPQPTSKWLDVNPQLYNLQKQNEAEQEVVNEIQPSIKSSRYNTPNEQPPSVTSLPSPTSSFIPEISQKKLGKQPLQTPKFLITSNYRSSDSGDTWSESQSSSPIDNNNNADLNLVTSSSPNPAITEAEAFKRGIQQHYKEKDEAEKNAQNAILKNIFAPSSPKSNTTSQIRYYDDNDDELNDYGSSQVRTYTMTPRSRYSQQLTTPSSSANLTPEEYMKRKRSRENSFMLLVDNETKQQFWLRAIKQSSLGHWLRVFTPSAKKLKNFHHQRNAANSSSNKVISHHNSNISIGDIRLHHQSTNGNRIIQKKKGFYKKNGNRRQEGIVM